MNEGEMFDPSNVPEIEIVDMPKEEDGEDLNGQIAAIESEIRALELQYNESNTARIEALTRQKEELEKKRESK